MVTIALASLLMGQVLLGKGSILKRAIGMVVVPLPSVWCIPSPCGWICPPSC